MKIKRPYTEKYHRYDEGDTAKPIKCFYKKKWWKRYDRKRFFKQLFKKIENV